MKTGAEAGLYKELKNRVL